MNGLSLEVCILVCAVNFIGVEFKYDFFLYGCCLFLFFYFGCLFILVNMYTCRDCSVYNEEFVYFLHVLYILSPHMFLSI